MLARRNAKRVERLNVTQVEWFVVGTIEWDLDVDSGSPGVDATLNLA